MPQIVMYTNLPAGRRTNQTLTETRLEGATSSAVKQPDGRFTVTAIYPDAEPPPAMPAAETLAAGWMSIAQAEEGVSEAEDGGSNPRIEAYHATTSGGAEPDSVPWCSSFVNYCMSKAGFTGTNSKRARDWMAWGNDSRLRPGAVVVLDRGSPPQAHVGFFAGDEGDRIRLLGGNQGNKVCLVRFEKSRILAVRWPTGAAGSSATVAAPQHQVLSVRRAYTFADLESEYRRAFTICSMRPTAQQRVDDACNLVEAGRRRYDALAGEIDIPWYIIGMLHLMECSCRFDQHLHNGDPLTSRTVRVPTGRPEHPPEQGAVYDWEESAIDALSDLRGTARWTVERLLFHAERYNGWGYRMRGLASPYLWSGSNLYERGKFVRDGEFDPVAVSDQIGVGVVLRRLVERGIRLEN